MEMHKEFADWYRTASVAPPLDLLEQRWAGVKHVTGHLDRAQVIELLRLFEIRLHTGLETPDFLDTAFRNYDSAFPNRGHLEELRVLAGAILRNAIEDNHEAAVAAAYGLTCAAFGRAHVDSPTREHIDAALRFLTSRAIAIRESATTDGDLVESISKERLNELLPQGLFAVNATPQLREPLLTALITQSANTTQSVNQQLAELRRVVQAQREESNFLWWLQNGFSKDLELPFSKLDTAKSACVLPMELANLTVFTPGPPGILGMIVSALAKTAGNAKGSIQEIINAAPRGWREAQVAANSKYDVGILCPILFAMKKSLETDGEDDWIPAHRKLAALKTDDFFAVRDIAYQVYRERMFVRALSEMDK
jgi:hypothetical protein